MRMGPVFFLVTLPLAARAQSETSLGLGVGTVRYSGGSTPSAASLSPAAQIFSPSFFLGATGTLSALPNGVWAAQGRGDAWVAAPRAGVGPQLAASLSASASSRSDGVAAAGVYAIGEVVVPAGGSGAAFGAGLVSGAIERQSGVTSLRARARVWSRLGGGATQLGLSVEPTRFLGAWYTDLAATATTDRGWGPLTGSAWIAARVSATYGSKAAASATLQYFIAPKVSLEAGVGSYLSDPFQGLPRAGYVSAGVRLHSTPRRLVPPPPAPPVAAPRLAPLVAARRGDSVVVRFRMEGARSVAIAGDWNSWQPMRLQALGGDIWEAAFLLAPGTYHFNLLVDGTDWVVPGGVAAVPDGMGGLVAVLTVL
jgi:AMP-activated protein kinase-like protein